MRFYRAAHYTQTAQSVKMVFSGFIWVIAASVSTVFSMPLVLSKFNSGLAPLIKYAEAVVVAGAGVEVEAVGNAGDVGRHGIVVFVGHAVALAVEVGALCFGIDEVVHYFSLVYYPFQISGRQSKEQSR